MANFKEFAPKLHKWEKGFVNDPDDAGGATMDGVTLVTYTKYRLNKGLPKPTVQDLKNMSSLEWNNIMKSGYWDKLKADEIKNQSLAELMSDWVVNSGVGKIKNIQTFVGTSADGIVGPKTISAINFANQYELFKKVWNGRKEFYLNIVKNKPSQEKFLKGWLNRLNDYKFSEK